MQHISNPETPPTRTGKYRKWLHYYLRNNPGHPGPLQQSRSRNHVDPLRPDQGRQSDNDSREIPPGRVQAGGI